MSQPVEPRHRSIGPRSRRSLLVGFSATLILLFGLANLVQPSDRSIAASDAHRPVPRPRPAASRAEPPPRERPPGSSPSSAPSSSPSSAASSSIGRPSPSVPPSPSPSGDPVLVGAGDIADCGLSRRQRDGRPRRRHRGHGLHGRRQRLRGRDRPTSSATATGRPGVASSPGPGRPPATTTGPRATWPAISGTSATAGAPAGVSWYSYDLGTWHVIVLDSGLHRGERLRAGLGAGSLAGRGPRGVVGTVHHSRSGIIPRFSSGFHGNDRNVAPFWEALYAAGADVDRQRSRPRLRAVRAPGPGRDARTGRAGSASSSSAPAARTCARFVIPDRQQ